jgi:hypothetical protein
MKIQYTTKKSFPDNIKIKSIHNYPQKDILISFWEIYLYLTFKYLYKVTWKYQPINSFKYS